VEQSEIVKQKMAQLDIDGKAAREKEQAVQAETDEVN
jgi:hypothetical protein